MVNDEILSQKIKDLGEIGPHDLGKVTGCICRHYEDELIKAHLELEEDEETQE